MRRLAQLMVGLGAALAAPSAWAQGCVMCRNSAAAGGADAARTFDLAILVLLIPTLSIFVGILVFAFLRCNRQADEADEFAPFNHASPIPPPRGTSFSRTDIPVCPQTSARRREVT